MTIERLQLGLSFPLEDRTVTSHVFLSQILLIMKHFLFTITMLPSVSLYSVCRCSFLQEYGIKGFPTIKVFAPGKPPVDYQGARDVKPIAEFALQQVLFLALSLAREHRQYPLILSRSCENTCMLYPSYFETCI